jgi:hypothetical protein
MKGKGDSMHGVLDQVLKQKNHARMQTIQPKDLRSQQMSHINDMIREKKLQALSPAVLSSKHSNTPSA